MSEPTHVGCYERYSFHGEAQFAEALELVEQGAPADAEGLCGFRAVGFVLAQGLQDGLPFNFLRRSQSPDSLGEGSGTLWAVL